MEPAAAMQNDRPLMRLLEANAVVLSARGRLRGFSPALDGLLMPYAFSDVQEAEVLALLVRPPAWLVWLYRLRHVAAVCAGGLLAGAVWAIAGPLRH